MKTFLIVSLAVSAVLNAEAMRFPPVTLPEPAMPVMVKLPPEPMLSPIQVTDVEISAEVAGMLTKTTVQMRFFNPNKRVLEGELSFPLPANATISGYALDINGQMVDGVIVDKDKARVVFDEITRQGIDPGLVEQSAGNVFKTRLYPLPSRGSRIVRVSYVSTVDCIKHGNQVYSYYVQPLRYKDKLNTFKLTLDVMATFQPPQVVSGPLANLSFGNWQSMYRATTELKDIVLSEDLVIGIMDRPASTFVVQDAADDKRYFHYAERIEAKQSQAGALAQVPVVLWDASASRGKSDHSAEYDFLRVALAGKQAIPLVIFRNAPEAMRECRDVDDLIEVVSKVVYDGATSLETALKAVPSGRDVFLFSDGLDTFSAVAVGSLKLDGRLSVFYADKDQNAPVLRGLASRTGGIAIDLRKTTAEDAATALSEPTVAVSSVKADGVEIMADAEVQHTDGHLMVAGVIGKAVKTLIVTVKQNDDSREVKLVVGAETTLPAGTLVRTMFGQMRLARMIEDNASDEDMAAVGKEFSLVTPSTSLLVLDSLQQYLKYGIRPPETLPEMRKQFDAQFKPDKKNDDRFELQPNEPVDVDRQWEALVTWHKKDYPKTCTKLKEAEAVEDDDVDAIDAIDESFFRRVDRTVRRASGSRGGGRPNGRRGLFASGRRDSSRVPAERDFMPLPSLAPMHEPPRDLEPLRNLSTGSGAPNPIANRELQALQVEEMEDSLADVGSSRAIIRTWEEDTPYMKDMESHKRQAYEVYLKLRKDYADVPGFYMDCADFLIKNGLRELGVRVLSNLAELELENKALLRILGYKLRFMGELTAAEMVFRKVVKIAKEEPQSYRDLGLTLDEQGRFQEAVDQLMIVVNHKFDSRFPEIESIALVDINRIIARAKRANVAIMNVPEKYIRLIDADFYASISWDADMTDMDIWVTDPFNVKCYYGNRYTPVGGRNSCDFTQGYGPEVFMTRNAVKGKYRVQADYFGSHSQKLIGPVTLYAEIYLNYGRANESKQVLTFRLNSRKQTVDIATIEHNGVNQPSVHMVPFSYQIKTGDTLESIAVEQLGDKKYTTAILELNPTLKGREKKLPIGAIILLPANE